AEKAAMLEKSFIDHIAAGHGLVAFHGAITMQNNSPEFSKMLGGSFDYHPKQQDVTCNPVDPSHPIVRHFKGKPLIHHDEPYIFKNAYNEKNFHPLLEMDCSKMGAKVQSDKRYVSWIKKHKQGRVFYCSPSHNAHSFEKPELLQFILNGIQYAAGDLKCDDRPLKK
ncbi:MAG: ThuA domain-containing protein, partial [Kiritimatiellae bacterium]|nr:ThuA domain-containing protein [Kiritimatiellia bacterium]